MACGTQGINMDPNKLPQLAGDLYVALCSNPTEYVNFGGVRTLNFTLDGDTDRLQIDVNNRAPLTGTSVTPIINVEFLETVDAEKIAMIYGLEAETIIGTSATFVDIIGGLNVGPEYAQPLSVSNADKTAVEITTVTLKKLGSTDIVLAETTDYVVGVSSLGETTIALVEDGVGDIDLEGWSLEVEYTATPNKGVRLKGTKKFKSDEIFRVVIVTEPDAQGRRNKITLDNCTFGGNYQIDFNDLTVAGDLQGTTGTFTGGKGSEIVIDIMTI